MLDYSIAEKKILNSWTQYKLSADSEEVVKFKMKFPKLLKENDLFENQQFNCNEMVLRFRLLSSKTLTVKGEALAPVCKNSKKTVIVLGFNPSGNLQFKIMIIWKSKKPRASRMSTTRVFIYITEIRKVRGWVLKFWIGFMHICF